MTNLDLIGAIALTGGAAAVAATLIAAAFSHTSVRIAAGAVLAVWFALVVAAGLTPAFDQRLGVGTPGLGVAVTLPVAIGVALAVLSPRLRRAFAGIPLPTLIAVNTIRLLGVMMVLFYVAGRLPAPFAPTAGYGDIAIGLLAPAAAFLAARQLPLWRAAAWLWNGLGMLDLFTAVGLGVVSAAGSPVRLIYAVPDTGAMTALPLILIPAFLVPLLMLIHIAVFDRLIRTAAAPGNLSRGIGSWAARLAG